MVFIAMRPERAHKDPDELAKPQSIDDGEPSVLRGMCDWGEPFVPCCDPNEH